jgi:antitoxin YefM
MAKTIPVRELRAELAEVLDAVADLREHVIVTRRGKPAAVIVPVDEYEALEETAEILSDARLMRAIERGRREAAEGKTVPVEKVRAELRKRKKR